MNVEQVLTRLHINPTSRLMAVQDVRALIEASENPIGAARVIISNLTTDTEYKSDDAIEARMTAQYLVENAILLGEKYDPLQALRRAAQRIAANRVSDPWFFWKPTFGVETTTSTREGVNVEVKADGSIKKGGKQVLAAALFEKHKALTNAEIIAIFMAQLDMSKPGATTYLYNCKKAAK